MTHHISYMWICVVNIQSVRSECFTCTFRASCCSARLSRPQIPVFAGSSVRVQESTSSPTGIGIRLYGVRHMVKDHSVREETRCRHIGYSFRLAAKVVLLASSHRKDNTYHGLCYTSCGALAGTRNSSMGPP